MSEKSNVSGAIEMLAIMHIHIIKELSAQGLIDDERLRLQMVGRRTTEQNRGAQCILDFFLSQIGKQPKNQKNPHLKLVED